MKNALDAVVHWLMMTAAALGSFIVQLLFLEDTGETSSSFLFSNSIYRVNPVCFMLGYVIFFSLHLVLWNRYQKHELKRAKDRGTSYAAAYCLGVLFISLIIFLLSIFILFAFFTGMTINIEPGIAELNGLVFAGYIFLFTVINLIIMLKKDKSRG